MYINFFLQSNPEGLYMTMTHVQADVLVSNKVNIPKCKSWSVFTTNKWYLSISL